MAPRRRPGRRRGPRRAARRPPPRSPGGRVRPGRRRAGGPRLRRLPAARRHARRRLRPGRRRPRRAPAPPYARPAAVTGGCGRARGVGRHRCPFATFGGRTGHGGTGPSRSCRSAAGAAQPLRPRPGRPRRSRDGAGRDRVRRREHLRRGGGPAAVGRGGGTAGAGRLPRGQHARRDGGLPFAPVLALRLGLGPPGRRGQLGARTSNGRAHHRVRGHGPSAGDVRPGSAGRGTSGARPGRGGGAGRAPGRRSPPEPECRAVRGRLRGSTRPAPGRHERLRRRHRGPPGTWGRAGPGAS